MRLSLKLQRPVAGLLLLIGGLVLSAGTVSVQAAETVRSGIFSGLSDHSTQGTASIVKTADGYAIVLGDDFVFDGAPDPKVALGKNGKFDASTLLAPLQSDSGTQTFAIPASIDVADFNEIYIWCEKYSVGLGVAPLN